LSIVPNRAASTTQRNLAVCFPDLPELQRLGLARESLQHTARSMLEMGKAWMLPIVETRALVREESGVDQLRSTIANKQGVILLAPHLSNWEILGFYVDADMPTSFMYQPPANPAIDRLIREARTRSGIHMAPTSRKGVSQVIKALENGELVGILPDQVPPDGSGVFVPFFGQTAFTMTLVSKLVQRTGAKVFCGFAQRLPHSKGFKVVVKEVMPEFYSSDLEQSVAAMNLSVEELVLMDVVQYQWEYKRFRRQPDDSEFYP
ncbi:MAG: lysophospholipid acyltransferase family protein, partial [Gammaproteobacteria bacterium]